MECEFITKKGTQCTRKAVIGECCTQHSTKTVVKEIKETITITFAECAENHAGMQEIGQLAEEGFTILELKKAKKKFQKVGKECEFVDLDNDAGILIVRDFADETKELFKELKGLDWDKKALMRGKVVNKNARHNLCFADFDQDPDYPEGKGRVIDFADLPFLSEVREQLPKFLGEKADNLLAEGNYYYDLSKTYINFHGDVERRIVIAVRLGETMPLYFQWYQRGEKVGEMVELCLNDGDLYIMSEKATGNDWKKRNVLTLRHSAGNLALMK
jgi:hypothetical protein